MTPISSSSSASCRSRRTRSRSDATPAAAPASPPITAPAIVPGRTGHRAERGTRRSPGQRLHGRGRLAMIERADARGLRVVVPERGLDGFRLLLAHDQETQQPACRAECGGARCRGRRATPIRRGFEARLKDAGGAVEREAQRLPGRASAARTSPGGGVAGARNMAKSGRPAPPARLSHPAGEPGPRARAMIPSAREIQSFLRRATSIARGVAFAGVVVSSEQAGPSRGPGAPELRMRYVGRAGIERELRFFEGAAELRSRAGGGLLALLRELRRLERARPEADLHCRRRPLRAARAEGGVALVSPVPPRGAGGRADLRGAARARPFAGGAAPPERRPRAGIRAFAQPAPRGLRALLRRDVPAAHRRAPSTRRPRRPEGRDAPALPPQRRAPRDPGKRPRSRGGARLSLPPRAGHAVLLAQWNRGRGGNGPAPGWASSTPRSTQRSCDEPSWSGAAGSTSA